MTGKFGRKILTILVEREKIDCLKISEGFPSGQRGQTVNLLAQPSEVRILPPPPRGWRESFTSRVESGFLGWAGVADIQTNSGGCSSTVELQPSKLITWVRFPSPAPAVKRAHIAQSVEHLHGKEGVTGSNPVVGSRHCATHQRCRCNRKESQLTIFH